MKKLCVFLMLLAIPIFMVGPAQAVPVNYESTGSVDIFSCPDAPGLADFTGSLEYKKAVSDTTLGQLIVNLTNTTSAITSSLTGFVMNNPEDKITSITLSSLDYPAFSLLGLSNNGLSASPFGDFDFGASTGGSFLGGNTAGAIPIGGTGSFTFNMVGAGLDTLSTTSFIEELADGQFFIARFQGIDTVTVIGGSDKVPACPVPLPGAVLLLGAGLVRLVSYARRRKED